MIKKIYNGLFGHFLLRSSVIQLCAGILLLMLVLPFFSRVADKFEAEQGLTFANSTLAATSAKLYENAYGDVVDYCMGVMKDTPNIKFIVYSKKNGDELVISDKQWSTKTKTMPYYKLNFNNDAQAFYIENQTGLLNKSELFVFSRPVYISGKYWGVLTVGFSKHAYLATIRNFYWTVITFTIAICFLSLFFFYLSSKKIRTQISAFEVAAKKLAEGQLSTRIPESSIGEIGVLGQAINKMSLALEEKSTRLFQLAQVVEQTNDTFILFDAKLNIIFVNDAIKADTGFAANYFVGKSILEFSQVLNIKLSDLLRDIDWVAKHKMHTPSRDVVLINKSMKNIDVEMRLEIIANNKDNEQNFLLVISNIANRKVMEKELHQLAYYDKLTDLPNRRMFMDHLRQTVKTCHREHKAFALFFLDLDNFKFLNDSLGHEAGDQFLIAVGDRLKELFRNGDMVTRLGGDEFTVLIEDLDEYNPHAIKSMAEKLVNQLTEKPILIAGRLLNISASVGVACFPKDGNDSDILLRNADTAMYVAKKQGKNRYALFSSEMSDILSQRMEMETALKAAIKSGDQIQLNYQPIVNIKTTEIVAVEALARWVHPEKGHIPPYEFIGIAEKSELIISLSHYLLEIAFNQTAAWQKNGTPLLMSVNISVRHFESQNFIKTMRNLLAKHQVEASNIQLEFTESIMLDSTNETILKFEQLKLMGFTIAIDDFGTGYSSLGYIHQLPIDVIKIDRSFVHGMLDNNKTNAIVAAIAKLSGTLGIKTVAEGIEIEAQAERLRQFECEYGQGYLYNSALPIDEFEKKYLTNAVLA